MASSQKRDASWAYGTAMSHGGSMVNLVDENDDMDENDTEEANDISMGPPSKSHRKSSTSDIGSSTARTVKGPLNLYIPQKPNEKKRKGEAIDLNSAKKIRRERAIAAFARWIYDVVLPFNSVNYTDNFGEFIKAVGQYGQGMKRPTYHEVKVPYLKKELEETNKIIEEHKVQWQRYGCSIMMDKWIAKNGKMMINVLVNSLNGSVFLESYDASVSSTDSTKMFNLFEKTILKIGKDNVIQVVTDNTSENVKVGHMLKGVFPHIFWTPCVAQCINMMFGDIFKEAPYSTVFAKAVRIHSYISQRPLLLNMMRRYTNQRNLMKPAKTRFTTTFLTLRSFYLQKNNLRTLFMSTEWKESRFAKEVLGQEVATFVISPLFWNDIVQALKVCGPLITVLRLVDGEEGSPMGYIYEAMDRAKEAIEKSFNGEVRKYEKVFEIIDTRWTDHLDKPLHAAGHLLNPGLFYTKNERKTLNKQVWAGYHACVERLVPDVDLQDKIGEELGVYMKADRTFGYDMAIRARTRISPVEWWMLFGHRVPNLQEFAIRVQISTCSSFRCERNWSVYEHINTKKRNKLELKRLNDLVFVKYNRTLIRRYKAHNTIDPIMLDNIDEANKWLIEVPHNHENVIYEGEDLTQGHVAMASGVEENIYGFRGSTSRSKERVATSSSGTLASEVEENIYDEEDDDQYSEDVLTLQEFAIVEEE
ncbi:uncharacterized protein LOC132636862 [Lycium barbarum]|uniref:uncharacterized protein LOC132636862 n=1 Tax=Lycium barbarum TaxID=112863 RepID=UPI00293EC373|nr:uncharacterized protein LOC132636862 [Lycium barbarum]XP_060209901.1 uncharacterized protein LOC132636862 [Lycium barbarum]